MFFIDSVEINGMWGRKDLAVSFHKNINIFIGKNGSGKTTFLDIITAILSVDIEKLRILNFHSCKIVLKDFNKKTKTISLIKDRTEITYTISKSVYNIPLVPVPGNAEIGYRSGRLMSICRHRCEEVKQNILSFCTLSNISVYRDLHDDRQFSSRENSYENTNFVDIKLQEMLRELCELYRSWDKKVFSINEKFRHDMLTVMLYDLKYDSLENIPDLTEQNVKKLKDGLVAAYKKIGLATEQIESKIDAHIKRIKSSIDIKNNLKPGDKWNADDAFPLTLLTRSIEIVKLLEQCENEKCDILSQYEVFRSIFYSFSNKNILIRPYMNDALFSSDETDDTISAFNLSSGEKQLFILLVEALLMKYQYVVSITDEPELSLHIDWQRKLLDSIVQLNPNAQLIVATHSPEIAGGFSNSIINMESIMK